MIRLSPISKPKTAENFVKISTIFLQIVVILIGIGVFAFLLWEPHSEGRNAHATLFEIYFKDPFLAYAYIASIPFFLALFQAFKVLQYARENTIFSEVTVKAFRTIKHCVLAIIAFVAAGEVYLFLFQRDKDDIAGGVAMGVFIMFISATAAAASVLFEHILQNAISMLPDSQREE